MEDNSNPASVRELNVAPAPVCNPDCSSVAKISIVTPNYNYGHYIADTIESVAMQHDPNLEYIVLDGASKDNSCAIIESYSAHISHWESKPDNGQADAIARGFEMSSGKILGWLNSDDMYLPGALRKVRQAFSGREDEAVIVFGNCVQVNQETHETSGSDVVAQHTALDLSLCDYVIQPASFWTRKTQELVGPLDTSLRFGFDWEWFIRAARAGVRFCPIEDFLCVYRVHAEHKTGVGGDARDEELATIFRQFNGSRVADAFLRMKNDPKVRRAYALMSSARLYRLMDMHRIVHKLFFAQLAWAEFDQIRRM